jgi:membrane-bound serine protease (ClpP class)
MIFVGVLLATVLVGLTAAPAAAGADSPEGRVLVFTVSGVINPLTARYLEAGLREADAAAAVVVRLNTPGGLETSMRRMVQAMLNSAVPVVVYVAPPGARAASAGMFITLAAHVAAMAPATNIGAAHPVALGGRADDTAVEKLVNDAAALARSLAETRGRNAEWAERAVRESVSITAQAAVERDVIDLIARDLPGLLGAIDGRTVTTTAGPTTLATAGVAVVERPMSLPSRILQALTHPNIAYLLFTLGLIGLLVEFYNPGMLVPGVLGGISLIVASVAFSSLPINWAAVLLLLLAVGLLIAELLAEGVGILGVGGLTAFVLGSLMLYSPLGPTSPAMPAVRVSPWLIGTMTGLLVGFFALVLRALVRAHRGPVATGVEALTGRVGIATSDLVPEGRVRIATETWRAVADPPGVRTGEEIVVVGVSGITLRVRRRPAPETDHVRRAG